MCLTSLIELFDAIDYIKTSWLIAEIDLRLVGCMYGLDLNTGTLSPDLYCTDWLQMLSLVQDGHICIQDILALLIVEGSIYVSGSDLRKSSKKHWSLVNIHFYQTLLWFLFENVFFCCYLRVEWLCRIPHWHRWGTQTPRHNFNSWHRPFTKCHIPLFSFCYLSLL